MVTLTFVPAFPLNFSLTSSLVIPMQSLPSIFTILSPERIPRASLGPPVIGETTVKVSFTT